MEKVELYYTLPIFIPNTTITTDNPQTTITFSIKQIGTGSYANVFKYKDTFYDRHFVIKRAKKDLSAKELERFKREFEEMKEFSSPYILEVFRYDETKMNTIWNIWITLLIALFKEQFFIGGSHTKRYCKSNIELLSISIQRTGSTAI